MTNRRFIKQRKYIKNTARSARCFLGHDRKFSIVIFASPNFMQLFCRVGCYSAFLPSRTLRGFFAEHAFLLEYHKYDYHDRDDYDRYGDADSKSHYHAVILFFDIDGSYLT